MRAPRTGSLFEDPLPGRDQLSTATRLVTEDDLSVAAGFFAVAVRPWQVMMMG
jgi:hypothetical protein